MSTAAPVTVFAAAADEADGDGLAELLVGELDDLVPVGGEPALLVVWLLLAEVEVELLAAVLPMVMVPLLAAWEEVEVR